MANAPGHALGENIGWFLESMVIDDYKKIAESYDLYCDYKHKRKARNNKSVVSWRDIDGNKHDLDVVFEEDGSEEKIGKPRAFIEVAWRRYTKHAKNKCQEISGAIKPIIARFQKTAPFHGVVLAGEFTPNSLKQLRSEGFAVLYFDVNTVFKVFREENINIDFFEFSKDDELLAINQQLEKLKEDKVKIERIRNRLHLNYCQEIEAFNKTLHDSITRKISSISICILYGSKKLFHDLTSACAYILDSEIESKESVCRYEINLVYSNDDSIEYIFHNKEQALSALEQLK